MFEKAARMKLRFIYRGQSSAEDLWDIPIEDLDAMFKDLNRLNKGEESLLDESGDPVLELKVNIIKHVVAVRLKERADAENEKDRAERKQTLLGIIAEKQSDELRSMSVEDLTKLVDGL